MPEAALQTEAESNTAVSHAHPVTRILRTGESSISSREIANETPVAIEFDGAAYAVMMATPADLEDFAVGFALSERIISDASDIARIDIRYGERGVGIDLRLHKITFQPPVGTPAHTRRSIRLRHLRHRHNRRSPARAAAARRGPKIGGAARCSQLTMR